MESKMVVYMKDRRGKVKVCADGICTSGFPPAAPYVHLDTLDAGAGCVFWSSKAGPCLGLSPRLKKQG